MGINHEQEQPRPPGQPRPGAAFLMTQIGTHAANLFAQALAPLDLTPPQAGLLRMLAADPGRSQRALADALGMPQNRFVAFVDTLEQRGLVERRKNPEDRRLHALYLTPDGLALLGKVRGVAIAHEQRLLQALSEDEHRQLTALLRRVAAREGLHPGVHPGYRSA
ncbi:MarR family winged helix-turn-helix transcriptional regulator [Embleya sp. AB8]|uniref:MarR family winged helix-turn-helix transcriptional regulator n=1 Tax=Embleya sp. AB8 TaxID=3156304 RepID=UPI003C7745BA